MGEAKRRRKLKQQILENFQYCIYCGGQTLASTVDHLPPRAVFDLRRRPRGLEFPACHACNHGGRLDELIAAMLSRIYPDPSTEAVEKEMEDIFRAVNTNCPGLLEEMVPSFRQKKLAQRNWSKFPIGGGALNCQGPLLNEAIHRFGAKIGYGLHFHLTGKPVPLGGAACVWWYTNYQAVEGDIPDQLLKLMGASKTLRQGRWEVGNQFRFASISTENGTMSAHFSSFRLAFAVCAFVAEQADKVRPPDEVHHVSLHIPGWLKTNSNQKRK